MSGYSSETMKKDPALEIFNEKSLEVIMLDDHRHEPLLQKLKSYGEKTFESIQKAEVTLHETEEERTRFTKAKDVYKPLLQWWIDLLIQSTERYAVKHVGT